MTLKYYHRCVYNKYGKPVLETFHHCTEQEIVRACSAPREKFIEITDENYNESLKGVQR